MVKILKRIKVRFGKDKLVKTFALVLLNELARLCLGNVKNFSLGFLSKTTAMFQSTLTACNCNLQSSRHNLIEFCENFFYNRTVSTHKTYHRYQAFLKEAEIAYISSTS